MSKVEALNLRRVGGQVYADLPSLREGHEDERVSVDSTCPEFERHWMQATWDMTAEQGIEANMLLEALNLEATEWAYRESRKPQDYTGALDRIAARLEERNAR